MTHGRVVRTDAVRTAWEAAHRIQPVLHPFTSLLAEQEVAAPPPVRGGDLAGTPVSVKDVLDVAGLPCAAGSALMATRRPARDAAAVARLQAAGATVIGKTTTPEFGLSWTTASDVSEETANPWDPDRTAGGSSGGAAVSVATGVVPLAVGTDDAGSVRLPAAFCGVVGFVGSSGRVPLEGIVGRSRDFTRIGMLARDVATAALGERVMAGSSGAGAPYGLPARAAWWRPADSGVGGDPTESVVRRAAEDTGVVELVEEVEIFARADEAAFAVVNEVDRYDLHGRDVLRHPAADRLRARTREIYERGRAHTPAELVAAHRRLARTGQAVRELLDRVTLLVSPTAICLPPPLGGRLEDRPPTITAYTLLSSAYGLPAVTIPCGLVSGIPVGLQVIGRHGADDLVLAVAGRLEVALGWTPTVPFSTTDPDQELRP